MARNTTPLFGKGSLARYFRGFLRHHIYPAETRYWCDPTVAVPLAHGKRVRDLHDLHLENIVADTPRRFLSSSKRYSGNLGNSSGDWTAFRDDYRSNRFPKGTTVSLHRMVLVFGNAPSSDWPRSGWRTRPRGPVHLSPSNWSVCGCGMACCRISKRPPVQITACCNDRSRGISHRCPGVGGIHSDFLLAQQRDSLDPCSGRDF